MQNKSKISVILPVYNSEKYLKECIDSILMQEEKNFELKIINNGSIDRTLDIIKSYDDKRITLIHFKKQFGDNSARAINIGLGLSDGEYLTWISSDDYYPKEVSLKTMVDVLNRNENVGMASGRYRIVGKEDKIVGNVFGNISYKQMKESNHIGGGFLFRRKCFEKIGYMDENLLGVDDWDYWIRLSKYFTIRKIKNVVYCWRRHDTNMASDPERMTEIKYNLLKIRKRYSE